MYIGKVVMLCTHHLNSHYKVGSHYYYEYFKKHANSVVYYSAPISPLHLFQFHIADTRKRLKKTMKISTNEVIPLTILPPLPIPFLNSNLVVDNWLRLSNVKLSDEIDILYIDNIFYFNALKGIKCRKLIFRIMDMHLDFPGWSKNLLPKIRKIIAQADEVIYSAKSLEFYAKETLGAKRAYHIPNGIDFNRNTKTSFSSKEKKFFSDPNQRIAVYVGSFDSWFDEELVKKCATLHSDITFLLIGNTEHLSKDIRKKTNVILWGRVEPERLIGMLMHCSVGLIPYRTNQYVNLINGINPLKLYEYFLAELPVITTYWQEIAQIKSPAIICQSDEEFIRQLGQIMNKEITQEERMKYRQFAEKYDWSKLFDEFLLPLLKA